jgi:hypothetical protein
MIDTAPAVVCRPAAYYQRAGIEALRTSPITFENGVIKFVGTTLKCVFLVEPTLAEYRANASIIPSVYDNERISRTIKRLLITDYMPGGRG